jgi:hypothetical protein
MKAIHGSPLTVYVKFHIGGYKKEAVTDNILPVPVEHKRTGILHGEKENIVMGTFLGHTVQMVYMVKTVRANGA